MQIRGNLFMWLSQNSKSILRWNSVLLYYYHNNFKQLGEIPHKARARDVEAAISSTASASTPIASAASASNRIWTLTVPGLYLIYELDDKHDYQDQQLTIYKGTLRFTRA